MIATATRRIKGAMKLYVNKFGNTLNIRKLYHKAFKIVFIRHLCYKQRMKSVAILHDIRSVINVGAIFRTCDAVGISKIYLIGITSTPLDRFGRTRADFAKAALGAEKTITWEFSDRIEPILEKVKKEGFKIVAIEQSPASVDYRKVCEQLGAAQKFAFLVGNEVGGLPTQVLGLCDVVAEIPMRGEKESLNVSTAFGVAVYRILDI
jgi:23S rRNA (guanosine2251-2'-O)-methyltransferase